MRNSKIKTFVVVIVILIIAGVWISATVKARQKAAVENVKNSWAYFPAEQIYIGQQLCSSVGKDAGSGKKAFKCPDGKTYVHNDWE